MTGGFTCPHCDTFNRCSCKSCKESYLSKGITENFVSWDEAGELLICSSCNKKFHEGDSLDIEWDRMIKDISESTLTKEVCYEWLFYVIKKEEKVHPKGGVMAISEYRLKEYDMYNRYGIKQEWFARSFGYHFKVSPYTIAKSGISGLRELQIDKILE